MSKPVICHLCYSPSCYHYQVQNGRGSQKLLFRSSREIFSTLNRLHAIACECSLRPCHWSPMLLTVSQVSQELAYREVGIFCICPSSLRAIHVLTLIIVHVSRHFQIKWDKSKNKYKDVQQMGIMKTRKRLKQFRTYSINTVAFHSFKNVSYHNRRIHNFYVSLHFYHNLHVMNHTTFMSIYILCSLHLSRTKCFMDCIQKSYFAQSLA